MPEGVLEGMERERMSISRDILCPFPQRRDMQAQRPDSVEKVGTELLLFDQA